MKKRPTFVKRLTPFVGISQVDYLSTYLLRFPLILCGVARFPNDVHDKQVRIVDDPFIPLLYCRLEMDVIEFVRDKHLVVVFLVTLIVCDRIRENKYQTVVVRSHVALDAFNDRGDHDVKIPVPSDVELDKLFLVKKFSDDLPKLFLYLPKMIYLFMPYKSNSENVQYIPLNKRSAAPKWNDAP